MNLVSLEMETNSKGIKTIELNDGKAGMQGLDKESINKIIYEASKGTPYFAFQEKRQKTIDSRVKELNQSLQHISASDRKSAFQKMSALGASLSADQDLSHAIVHVDMDAFYAAVEEEDNPTLKGKAMAVGSNSMLATSNYEARKYGVRAGMPGFIAKKLCPSLIIVPCNFDKYKRVSKLVCGVIETFDPNYCAASLDEMYFDLTTYIKREYKKKLHGIMCTINVIDSSEYSENADADLCLQCNQAITNAERDCMAYEIVEEIRQNIFSVTNLTASAGIAPNVMLSKVCSDQNKPNGQFQIPSTVDAIKSFVSTLPVKKVSGIGPVQAQILNAIGIFTCSDLWEKRDLVGVLFKPSSAEFYIRAGLGISSTTVKSDYVRKSIGVEQTFKEINCKEELVSKCQELCDEAVEDMRKHDLLGKVVVLKYKTTDFESHTRNHTLPYHTEDKEVISKAARKLLEFEIASISPKPLKLRLMGVRIVNLIREHDQACSKGKQAKINHFLKAGSQLCDQSSCSSKNHLLNISYMCMDSKNADSKITTDSDPFSTISNPTVYLNENPYEDIDSFSDYSSHIIPNCHTGEGWKELIPEVAVPDSKKSSSSLYTCPVCGKDAIAKSIEELNAHMDNCLSRGAIKEILSGDLINCKRKNATETKYNEKRSKIFHKTERKIDDYFK